MVQPRITAARIIAAIEGSDGIKSTIYGRVPCSPSTLDKWLRKAPTVLAAYETECNKMLGVAHSVVTENIHAARRTQKKNKGGDNDGVQVDSGDARWYLTKKGKRQGFGDDPAVQITQNVTTVADFRKDIQAQLAGVDELEE